jgi:hypothetical protein
MQVLKFSVAVSGQGRLMEPLVRLLKQQHRGVVIYDRNEEARRPPSNARIPPHPKVADVDVFFSLQGAKETATVRSGKGHRFFNYVSDPKQAKKHELDLLLKHMLLAITQLL